MISLRLVALLVALSSGYSQGLQLSGTFNQTSEQLKQEKNATIQATARPQQGGEIATGSSEAIISLELLNNANLPISESAPGLMLASMPIGRRRLDDDSLALASTSRLRGNKFNVPQKSSNLYGAFDGGLPDEVAGANEQLAKPSKGLDRRQQAFDQSSDELLQLMNQNRNLRSHLAKTKAGLELNLDTAMQSDRRSSQDDADQQIYQQLNQERQNMRKQQLGRQSGARASQGRATGNANQMHLESRKSARKPLVGVEKSQVGGLNDFGGESDEIDEPSQAKAAPRSDDADSGEADEEDDESQAGIGLAPQKPARKQPRLNKAASTKRHQNYPGGKPKAQSFQAREEDGDSDVDEQSSASQDADEDGDSTNSVHRNALVSSNGAKGLKLKEEDELSKPDVPFDERSIINGFTDDEATAAAASSDSSASSSASDAPVVSSAQGQQDLQVAAGHHHGKSHGHYYQYVEVPKKKAWKFGFKRGNHKHEIMRKEKGHKSHFHSHFKWHAKEKCKKKKKCKSVGEMKWEYKHDKKHHHHG